MNTRDLEEEKDLLRMKKMGGQKGFEARFKDYFFYRISGSIRKYCLFLISYSSFQCKEDRCTKPDTGDSRRTLSYDCRARL